MHPLKKIYCRLFQTGFKLAIPFLPYRAPRIIHKTTVVPKLLKKKNINTVLIITDRDIHNLGLIEPLKNSLSEHNISYTIYDKTDQNTTVENVEEPRSLYLNHCCQALIGFGGGSAMDCAKAVGARIAWPEKPVSKMKGILKIMKKIPFLIAVPTTAGTGSETTLATVITDDKTGLKFPIMDFSLIPSIALLDPSITRTLPPIIAATTGMDALTHAIEAYIGRSTTTSTRKDALKACALISRNLEQACLHPYNDRARENMLKASFLAGRAFSKSYVGYCHAVAHSLGGHYNIPHGLANAVILPYILNAYDKAVYRKTKQIAIHMNLADKSTPACTAHKKLIEWINETNRRLNIPDKLTGIWEEDIPLLAKQAEKEANPLYPVPVLMDAKDLEQFYYDIMG